jgi:HemY protein
MRILFWFLALAIAAVIVALAVRINAGYALFVAPPYRIEVSLNLLLFVLVGGFLGLYAAIRLAARTLRMPREVRAMRRRQKIERARSTQDSAVVALLEGRYGKTRQLARSALAIPGSSPLNAMIAARAAIDVRDFDDAETLLSSPEANLPSLTVTRMMLGAEIALEQGQPQQALAQFSALRREAGMHTAALRLELRALQAARRWDEIPGLLDQLVKRKVFEPAQADLIRISATSEQLAALSHDAGGLRDLWSRLPESTRTRPRVARAAARSFLALGGDREAADMLAASLEREWDPELLDLFGECHPADPMPQLEQAERWLPAHSQDATLLRVLGTLCQRAQLWGKAQTYLEASLALEDGWRAHLALGEMLGRQGREPEANAHFVAALKLATAALANNGR